MSSIKNSKDIESLEILLHSAKVYRNDISPIDCFYYCGICFDGNVPSAKSRTTQGCFIFSKVDYSSKLNENSDKQPRCFSNLKGHILTHLQTNTYHNTKLSQIWEANKELRETEARSKKV